MGAEPIPFPSYGSRTLRSSLASFSFSLLVFFFSASKMLADMAACGGAAAALAARAILKMRQRSF